MKTFVNCPFCDHAVDDFIVKASFTFTSNPSGRGKNAFLIGNTIAPTFFRCNDCKKFTEILPFSLRKELTEILKLHVK